MANYDQAGNRVGGGPQHDGRGIGQGQPSQYAPGGQGQHGAGAQRGMQQGGMQQPRGGEQGSRASSGAGRSAGAAYGGSPFTDLYSGFGGNPFQLISRLSEEMDRIFDGFAMTDSAAPVRSGGQGSGMQQGSAPSPLRTVWAPRIEVWEREGRLMIQADLPGVRKEDVNVQIEDDAVVIQGHRHQEHTGGGQGVYHSERSYGSFYRMIPLPEGVDAGQANATYRDGVLQIELPAPQPRQRGRRLEIRDDAARQQFGTPAGTAAEGNSTPGGQAQAEGSSERR